MPHIPILDSAYECGLVNISSKVFKDIYNLDTMELSEDYIYQDLSNDSIPTFEDLFWREIESSQPKIDIADTTIVDIIKLIQDDLHSLISEGMRTDL